jgi:CBS domain-containing protein
MFKSFLVLFYKKEYFLSFLSFTGCSCRLCSAHQPFAFAPVKGAWSMIEELWEDAMTIAAILKHKGSDVAAVRAETTISDVVDLLAARRIGAVLVQDPDRALLGIVSERDIIRGLAQWGPETLTMPVEQIMTRALQTATPATSVTEAMEIMTAGRFRHLPVVVKGRLVGIVSIGDIVNAKLQDQANEVDNLKAYVAGSV